MAISIQGSDGFTECKNREDENFLEEMMKGPDGEFEKFENECLKGYLKERIRCDNTTLSIPTRLLCDGANGCGD